MYLHTNIHNYVPTYIEAYVHTYIRMYIHTYLCTYIHTYKPTYIHTYIFMYIHTYLCTYIHTYVPTYIHTYLCTYIHTYIHTCLCTYIHTYIHTYLCTYIHTSLHTYTGIYIHAHAACTLTSAINPWKEVYRIAAGRRKQAATTNTLRQKDSTLTTNVHGTLLHMLKNLTPDNNQADDNELHKQTRAITQEVIDTADDKKFTVHEVKNAVESMGEKRRQWKMEYQVKCSRSGENRTPLHNNNLQQEPQGRNIPKEAEKSKIIPIIKPGKEESDKVSKFRPTSLLDIGRNVLEKILINRMNHHVYSRGHMNKTQFGFRPQKSTIDAAMAIKDFVLEGLAAGEVIALVSFDVQGAFEAAWWPGILKELRECGCIKNIYGLKKGYFIQ